MGVRYVIADPEPPTWWARNKVLITAVVCLFLGFQLRGGDGQVQRHDPEHRPSPSPSVSRSAP